MACGLQCAGESESSRVRVPSNKVSYSMWSNWVLSATTARREQVFVAVIVLFQHLCVCVSVCRKLQLETRSGKMRGRDERRTAVRDEMRDDKPCDTMYCHTATIFSVIEDTKWLHKS